MLTLDRRTKNRIILVICIVICLAVAFQFATLSKGQDGIVNKVKKIVTKRYSNIESIWIADSINNDSSCLFWIIVQYDGHQFAFVPVEFEHITGYLYRYVQIHMPIQRSTDIACVNWNDAYHFIINDKQCCFLKLKYTNGEDELVRVTEYPFCFHSKPFPSEYYYLDGNYEELN